MNHPLRFLPLLSLLLAGLWSSPLLGATVEAINKDSSRVILKLTQVELAEVEDDQTVLIEVTTRPTAFVVAGKLTKVNPVKKTVVVILETADLRFEKKQSVRFLSLFFNPLLSPLLTTYSQYHQYARSSVEGGGGVVFEKYLEKTGDSRSKATLFATQIAAEGYALISPHFFGAGFGYRRLDGTVDSDTDGAKAKSDVTINQIRPGAWIELETGWVIGLRYDYTLLDDVSSDGGPTFSYDLAQLVFGLTHFSPDFEYGVIFKDKATYTAVDTQNDLAGKSVKVTSTIKAPATLEFGFRDIQSPLFGWGMSLGYIFYERELKQGEALRSKTTIPELLRYRLTMEWRLDDGSKVDTSLSYAGGRDVNYVYGENITNRAGVDVTYAQPYFEQVMFGGTVALEGGAITLTDQAQNPTTGEYEDVAREVQTVAASLLAFARMEFDLLAKGRKR